MLGRIAMVAGVTVSIIMTTQSRAQSADTLQQPDTALHVKGLRSPQLAGVLGIFPGGGLFYAGAWKDGLRTYFGTVSAIGAGAMTIALGELQGCAPLDITCRPHGSVWPTRIAGGAMIASGIGLWGYQAVHAARIVRRSNAKKIAAARDTARTVPARELRGYVAPGDRGRAVALGVHATW